MKKRFHTSLVASLSLLSLISCVKMNDGDRSAALSSIPQSRDEKNICIEEEGDWFGANFYTPGAEDNRCGEEGNGCTLAFIEIKDAQGKSGMLWGMIQNNSNNVLASGVTPLHKEIKGVSAVPVDPKKPKDPGQEPAAETPKDPSQPQEVSDPSESNEEANGEKNEAQDGETISNEEAGDDQAPPEDGGVPPPDEGSGDSYGGANPEYSECSERTNCFPTDEMIKHSPLNSKNLPCAVTECNPDTLLNDGSKLIAAIPLKPTGKIDCTDPRITCFEDPNALNKASAVDKNKNSCYKKITSQPQVDNIERETMTCALKGNCPVKSDFSCTAGMIGNICKTTYCALSMSDPLCRGPKGGNSFSPNLGEGKGGIDMCKISPSSPACKASGGGIGSYGGSDSLGAGPSKAACMANPNQAGCKK